MYVPGQFQAGEDRAVRQRQKQRLGWGQVHQGTAVLLRSMKPKLQAAQQTRFLTGETRQRLEQG